METLGFGNPGPINFDGKKKDPNFCPTNFVCGEGIEGVILIFEKGVPKFNPINFDGIEFETETTFFFEPGLAVEEFSFCGQRVHSKVFDKN